MIRRQQDLVARPIESLGQRDGVGAELGVDVIRKLPVEVGVVVGQADAEPGGVARGVGPGDGVRLGTAEDVTVLWGSHLEAWTDRKGTG